MKVILFTGHYLESKRRAGFHWLAHAYHQAGWEVLFVTSGISWLSWLKRDHRFQYPVMKERNRVKTVAPGLSSYVWFTPWHPASFRSSLVNALLSPFLRLYSRFKLGPVLRSQIEKADLLIFESHPVLVALESVRRVNPHARLVYRVSDDLRVLKNHPIVLEAEEHYLPEFDRVSVPSEPMLRRWPSAHNVRLEPHGLDTVAFDGNVASPYGAGEKAMVWVGNNFFDHQFLEISSRLYPDWNFYVIGPIPRSLERANVHWLGELPFAQTVPYLKHARVGLLCFEHVPGAEVFTDSLKMSQYTYCRLPVVAPEFVRSGKPHVFCYEPGDEASIRNACESAIACEHSKIDRSRVLSWKTLADRLATEERTSL